MISMGSLNVFQLQEWYCEICGEVGSSPSNMFDHSYDNHLLRVEGVIKCNVCHITCPTVYSFVQHFKHSHMRSVFTCNTCMHVSDTAIGNEIHQMQHQ